MSFQVAGNCALTWLAPAAIASMMMSRLRTVLPPAIAGTLMLAGCGPTIPASTPPPRPAPPAQVQQVPPTQPAPPPVAGPFRQPKIMREPGLERVIGAHAAALVRQFGQPQLDVREGDARKMQFAGQACVLDVFLYPLRDGAEPEATWVEARRRSDGLDVNRASCVAALKR